MKQRGEKYPGRKHIAAFMLILLSCIPLTVYAAGFTRTANTRHYHVHLGMMAFNDFHGQYPINQGAQPPHTGGAVESGQGQHLTAAIFRRDNGKLVKNASVYVSISQSESGQSAHSTMRPIDINGYVSFETVMAMPPGHYTIRISIKGPKDVRPEVATFEEAVP